MPLSLHQLPLVWGPNSLSSNDALLQEQLDAARVLATDFEGAEVRRRRRASDESGGKARLLWDRVNRIVHILSYGKARILEFEKTSEKKEKKHQNGRV